MVPIKRNGVLLVRPDPDSEGGSLALWWDATCGGSSETFPPGPGTLASTLASETALPLQMMQTPDTCCKGWLCGYDNWQHLLHSDYIRRAYLDDTQADGTCRCLLGMRCSSHPWTETCKRTATRPTSTEWRKGWPVRRNASTTSTGGWTSNPYPRRHHGRGDGRTFSPIS